MAPLPFSLRYSACMRCRSSRDKCLLSPFALPLAVRDCPSPTAGPRSSLVRDCTRLAAAPGEHATTRRAAEASPRDRATMITPTTPQGFGAKTNTNFRHTWRFGGSAAPLTHAWARILRTPDRFDTRPGCRLTISKVLFRFSASERPSEIIQRHFRSIRDLTPF